MEDIEKMLISENTAVQALIQKEAAAIAKANARHALVSKIAAALPKGSPSPISINDFGYCANASIDFAGITMSLDDMLELYPPMECVDVTDGSKTQKPMKYVRDTELTGADILPIFPAYYRNAGKECSARWWTVLADLDVEITVRVSETMAEFKDLDSRRFIPQSFSYSTGNTSYFLRALSSPSVKPVALIEWGQPLQEFALNQGLDKREKAFVERVKKALTNRAFDFSGKDAVKRFYTQCTNNSDILNLFTDENVVEKLEVLVSSMLSALPEAIAITDAQFELIHNYCKEFFESRGRLRDNWTITERITHWLRKETGLDLQVRRIYTNATNQVAVSIYFTDVEKYPDWYFESNRELPSIRAQDIDVSYA